MTTLDVREQAWAGRLGRMAGLLVAAAATAACTGIGAYNPPASVAGLTADDLQARMGPATGRHARPDGGTRLEFARGPFGRHTWMIDLDAAGRAVRAEQVLTEATFATLRDGDRREDVLARIGRPSEVRPGGRPGGEVWSWRYDDGNSCLWFEVSMIGGVARQPGYGIDPRCDPGSADGYN